MLVKELIALLKRCNQEKPVEYESYSEMINMGIKDVKETEEIVLIQEYEED